MKNVLTAFVFILLAALSANMSASLPVQAKDYPVPPLDPAESWQPPYEGSESVAPQVPVEAYSQAWSELQIVPPPAIAPGTPGSIVDVYLVNSYGKILTNLYRNWACYLVVSFSGSGYFYLWEYYPPGTIPHGHWLCYRWYVPHAGVWRIGPFVAEPSDPAGRYVWKMWYLSGYSWSVRSLAFNYTRSYYPPDIPGMTTEPVNSPVINSFSANKTSIELGETVILTWTTTNASSVTISPGVGAVAISGSTTVTPPATTTYTLVAKGKSGISASSAITVVVMPRIPPTINAGHAVIKRGQSTSLSWNAAGAVKASITDVGNVSIRGTIQVSPDKATCYTLTATYIDGTTQSASVTVNVKQPPYLLWGLIALLAVAVVVIVVLCLRRPAKVRRSQAEAKAAHDTEFETTHGADTLPATTPVVEATPAKLAMPDGNEILLAGNARTFGRQDFESFMPRENVPYISRQHINIWYENGKYYIEDRSSTNGTKLNGKDIKGTGRHALADGDLIELAGKLSITFKGQNIAKEVQ